MKKIYFFIKICFFIVVISMSIYLKENDFLNIAPIGAFDQTSTIIQFNEFSNVLIGSSLLLLAIFFVYYRMSIHLSYITSLDKTVLFYYIIYFIIILITKFSFYEFTADMAQLTFMLSSITFLQSHFLKILPIGIIIYIPIIYLFFIQKKIVRDERIMMIR